MKKAFNIQFLMLFILCSTGCTQAQTEQSKVEPQRTDQNSIAITIGERFKIFSEVLGEDKELYIALPPKYDEHVQNYPVIFVLESEFLFEPTQTIAKYMAARSKMPESIVVGLANGEFDKRNELGYKKWGGIPGKYLQFFSQELIPYIEKNYRANTHRTIIGLSPSTGFLYEAFLEQPGLFSAYIALSAHLEWDRIEGTRIFDEVISRNDQADYPESTFYFGRAESDFPTFTGAEEEFDRALEKLKTYTPNKVNINVEVLKDEEHYLMCLAGIRSGLKAIYPTSLWRNPGFAGWDKNENYAQSYYKTYYDNLSSIYGFDIYPVENGHGYGFNFTGRIYGAKRWGTNQQVIQLARLGTEYYPNSANMHMILAEAYKLAGEKELAVSSGNKAVQLASKFNADQLEFYEQRLITLKN